MGKSEDSAAFIALVQATAGAAGGVFAAFTLMPLEVAKTRIQISHQGDSSTFGTIASIFNDEGPQALYSGALAKCCETGSKNFVYFYIYDAINAMAKQKVKLTTVVKLILGYIAGVGCTSATMPLEVLATKMQAEKTNDTLLVCAQRVLEREGITGLFTGFWYNIMLCVNPAIQNTTFDQIKDVILRQRRKASGGKGALSPFEAFVLGALAKAIATIVTYPMVRLKTIMQAGASSGKSAPSEQSQSLTNSGREGSTADMLRHMSFREDKAIASQGPLDRAMEMYRGIGSALMKSVLQAALLYMTKDQVAGIVHILFKLSARAFFRKDGRLKLGAFSGRPLAS